MSGIEEKIGGLVKEAGKEKRLGDKRAEQFYGLPKSAVYDPPNLPNGSEASKWIGVTGAAFGDFIMSHVSYG